MNGVLKEDEKGHCQLAEEYIWDRMSEGSCVVEQSVGTMRDRHQERREARPGGWAPTMMCSPCMG